MPLKLKETSSTGKRASPMLATVATSRPGAGAKRSRTVLRYCTAESRRSGATEVCPASHGNERSGPGVGLIGIGVMVGSGETGSGVPGVAPGTRPPTSSPEQPKPRARTKTENREQWRGMRPPAHCSREGQVALQRKDSRNHEPLARTAEGPMAWTSGPDVFLRMTDARVRADTVAKVFASFALLLVECA